MELTITEQYPTSGSAVLTLQGRLFADTAPALKTRLRELAAGGRMYLVIDLTGVPFIDSSGLSALVSGLKAATQTGGKLKLAGLNEQTRTVFRLTLLDRVFEFCPNAESALAEMEGTS